MSDWTDCQFRCFVNYFLKPKLERDDRNFILGSAFHLLMETWYSKNKFDFMWLKKQYKNCFEKTVSDSKRIVWRNKNDKDIMIKDLEKIVDNQILLIKENDLI